MEKLLKDLVAKFKKAVKLKCVEEQALYDYALMRFIKTNFRLENTTTGHYNILYKGDNVGSVEKNKDTKEIKEWLENE